MHPGARDDETVTKTDQKCQYNHQRKYRKNKRFPAHDHSGGKARCHTYHRSNGQVDSGSYYGQGLSNTHQTDGHHLSQKILNIARCQKYVG
jgi:hypothetical protein